MKTRKENGDVDFLNDKLYEVRKKGKKERERERERCFFLLLWYHYLSAL
jgi:hypothetical protein